MAENSGIGWTDHTMNFWWGCTKVSEECRYCYIDGIMKRAGKIPFGGPMRTVDWTKPHKWERLAKQQGRRFRVFTCSMSDFFHKGADEWRPEAWEVIRKCPSLDWLVLTKRPELIKERLPEDWGQGYPNVWLGVTCGISTSLHRLDILKEIPAALRWISAEPLLGPIDFSPYLDGSFEWIITGCEQAGKEKWRPMDMEWVRDIDNQCSAAGIAHFFKQRYIGTRISHDGLIDGVVRQKYPLATTIQPVTVVV
jgi:protein gp37